MTKTSREHHSDEFGQQPSAMQGWDPPMIGAPTNIILSGIVERESGETPPPSSVSVKAIVVTLIVMLALALVSMLLVVFFAPPP